MIAVVVVEDVVRVLVVIEMVVTVVVVDVSEVVVVEVKRASVKTALSCLSLVFGAGLGMNTGCST